MEKMTTIAISKDLRDRIKGLGMKGESYTQILEDMYEARKNQVISEILMDTSDCISIDDAIKELEKEIENENKSKNR